MNYKKKIEGAFDIRDKTGSIVPFVQNQAQDIYDQRRKLRNIILKIRQTGMSSKILADYAIDFITKPNYWNVSISYEEKATQRLFIKVKDYLEAAMRNVEGVKVTLKTNSKNELWNSANDAYFYIGTAGSRAFGRGDTIQNLHLSEMAWYQNTEFLKGVTDAVPHDGRIDIESTANGFGNAYQLTWEKASSEEGSAYTPIFIGLADVEEYNFSEEIYLTLMGKPFIITPDEEQLLEKYSYLGLQIGHLRFRRWKIASYTPEDLKSGATPEKLFKQEYPITPEEAFLSSGNPFFDMEVLEFMLKQTKEPILKGQIDSQGEFYHV